METVRVVVRGRVQGVGFRHYVTVLAESLGLSGEVWNRRDGAVEAVAGHSDPQRLDEFVTRLWHGPGYVAGVDRCPCELRVEERGFRVAPTR